MSQKTPRSDRGKDRPFRGLSTSGLSLMPSMDKAPPPCTAGPAPTDPGNTHWTDGYLFTPAGPVPRIKTRLTSRDRIATVLVRCGINRYTYTIAPGLYAAGRPDSQSEVLVTANFKLSVDHLRTHLAGLNAWILVLDTKGINVWCAAGKGSFSTREIVHRIEATGLGRQVTHRRLILPQLGATGVSAREVKSRSGFRVVYGPVRAGDLPAFLQNNRKADPAMRAVSFNFWERAILTPVEVQIALKPALMTALILFVLSGLGPDIFSLETAWTRGWTGLAALGGGLISGAVITPVLLPYIPGRGFALKGIITGTVTSVLLICGLARVPFAAGAPLDMAQGAALFLFLVTVSSYLAMNFTGATPFTSPSGVEKEMKRYLPVQFLGLAVSSGLWIYGGFHP